MKRISDFNYEKYEPDVKIIPHPEKEVKDFHVGILTSTDRPLSNSKALFIEYYDIIEIPSFYLLYTLIHMDTNTDLSKIMDFSELRYLSKEELMEYYIKRNYKNIFKGRLTVNTNENELERILLDDTHLFGRSFLPFRNAVDMFKKSSIVNNIYLWTPYKNNVLMDHIPHVFNQTHDKTNIKYVYGDLEKVLQEVNPDCTYVFSDIQNVTKLHQINRLNYASIVIPLEFRYNYDERAELAIDLDEIGKDTVYKLNLFSVFESN